MPGDDRYLRLRLAPAVIPVLREIVYFTSRTNVHSQRGFRSRSQPWRVFRPARF